MATINENGIGSSSGHKVDTELRKKF